MADVRESSGLTTLAALREHETRRLVQQTEAARARAEAEQRARLESEREAARLERERQRIERAASESLEVQRQAELSRLEAARALELERAERATLGHEALQLQLVEERGARRSAELVSTAQLLRQRSFAVLSAALCAVSWLGGGALYFGSIRPQAERSALVREQALAAERQARAAAEQGHARSARRNDELARRVSALEQELRDQAAAVPNHTVQGTPQKSGQPSKRGVNLSQPPCRDDGDPLNPCLKR
ncbi:MAG TPA: hypothetical protein VF294_07750 [Polyangiaceae bacterium]